MSNYVGVYILLALGIFILALLADTLFLRIRARFWMRRKWTQSGFHRQAGKYWVSRPPSEPNKPERIKENA